MRHQCWRPDMHILELKMITSRFTKKDFEIFFIWFRQDFLKFGTHKVTHTKTSIQIQFYHFVKFLLGAFHRGFWRPTKKINFTVGGPEDWNWTVDLEKIVLVDCALSHNMKPPQVDGHFTPLNFIIGKSQTQNEMGGPKTRNSWLLMIIWLSILISY